MYSSAVGPDKKFIFIIKNGMIFLVLKSESFCMHFLICHLCLVEA